SLNIGVGLGLLVQTAAESAEAGLTVRDIEAEVRSLIPHLYSIYCVSDPASLARLGLISPEQAAATEILGIMPILSVEEGRLVPFQKVRTTRHLLESFQEFVGEYDTPRHIAFSKGRDSRLRLRPLRQFVTETFPNTPFTEHILPPSLAALIGETAVGLVVLDTPPKGV
ncbi:MAG: DegV family protein, partial [Anaerolineales bacterium]